MKRAKKEKKQEKIFEKQIANEKKKKVWRHISLSKNST